MRGGLLDGWVGGCTGGLGLVGWYGGGVCIERVEGVVRDGRRRGGEERCKDGKVRGVRGRGRCGLDGRCEVLWLAGWLAGWRWRWWE